MLFIAVIIVCFDFLQLSVHGFDDTCTLEPGLRLKPDVDVEVIILVDRSQSMTPLREALSQDLKSMFQPSFEIFTGNWTFSVVAYTNWFASTKEEVPCFEVIKENATIDDLETLQNDIGDIEPVLDNVTKSALSHLALASKFFTSSGNIEEHCNVTKCQQSFTFFIIFTNSPAEVEENFEKLGDKFQDDGEHDNTCKKKPPSYISIQKSFFFTKESQHVVGFMSSQEHLESYKEVLEPVDVPFCGNTFTLENVNTTVFQRTLKECMDKHYKDFKRGRCVYSDPPGETLLACRNHYQ